MCFCFLGADGGVGGLLTFPWFFWWFHGSRIAVLWGFAIMGSGWTFGLRVQGFRFLKALGSNPPAGCRNHGHLKRVESLRNPYYNILYYTIPHYSSRLAFPGFRVRDPRDALHPLPDSCRPSLHPNPTIQNPDPESQANPESSSAVPR